MSETDWCHSSIRLPRSAHHQHAKSAALSYEDEKFSYLALTRAVPSARPASRIVKRPVMHSGHVQVDLCTDQGLVRTTVSRRHGDLYRAARKAEWGDDWRLS
jgi:ribosomal protein RSM22 (predicted rRNA methylase)